MTTSPQFLPAVTPGGRRWFTMDHLVTFGETSKAGFVYFTRFFEWQGLCRETCGYLFLADYMESLDEHHAMITSTASCELLSEVQAAETITLRMAVVWVRLHFMKGEFAFYRTHPDGTLELVARGEQVWANAVSSKDPDNPGFVPAPWPAEILAMCRGLGADISRAHGEQDSPVAV